MNNKKLYIVLAIVSLFFLSLISATAVALIISLQSSRAEAPNEPPEEVFIYVTETDSIEINEGYIRTVREYEGQIGIFDEENRLQEIIATHIKTLPKVDQDLLREGITVKSEKELYAIVEAYSD